MYSTCMKNDRYVVKCLIVSEYVTLEKFIVDTGARFSCYNYRIVDGDLCEEQLAGCETKYIGGFVQGETVRFYRYLLKQFAVGNIDMGVRDIWLTFDERVTDIILGMDILKQMMIILNPYNRRIYFCKDAEDYQRHFMLAMP